MEQEYQLCTSCGKHKGEHLHHIVPRSRGGSDLPSNLVLLCPDCHGRAHDVSFKSNTGVIAEGIRRVKEAQQSAQKWFDLTKIDNWLTAVAEHDLSLHGFLVTCLEYRLIDSVSLWECLEKNKRLALTGTRRSRSYIGIEPVLRKIWAECH